MLIRYRETLCLLLLSTALLGLGSSPVHAQTYVCMETNVGEICMEMLEQEAPGTVQNFLNYVTRGDFDNSLVHRNEPNFVIQMGGFRTNPLGQEIPQDPAIRNEFNVSNTRGTVAMAKLSGDPDSATNEFFINLTDNSANLDFNNGGFTVFARVVGDGMLVADSIGSMRRVDLTGSLGPAFGTVPIQRQIEAGEGVGLEDLVVINRVYVNDDYEPPPPPEPEEPEIPPNEDPVFMCTADWVQEVRPTEACIDTNMGEFCMELLHEQAPGTVANFLQYVAMGRYDGTLIHRSSPNFVVQGGGFRSSPLGATIRKFDPITNEFNQSNARGTVAMAKLPGDPNSATSEWFVNLVDNTVLDNENGGFTVFARVSDNGMELVDSISRLERGNLSEVSNAFNELPFQSAGQNRLDVNDLVLVRRAYLPGMPANPCLVEQEPVLTEYSNGRFIAPVRVGEQIFRIVFELQSTPPNYVFQAVTTNIIELADVGQETAVYDQANGRLTIPSARQGDQVLRNIIMTQPDPRRLVFNLFSVDLSN